MAITWSWAIELSANGTTWTDITRDVVKMNSISCKRGLSGYSPKDCVADIGTLSFTLDNSEANSAGLLGYYSPNHANCRSIFALNSHVRIKFIYSATTRYKFYGRIRVIEPVVGQFGARETFVQAVDYMQYFIDNHTERLAVQVDKRMDELITAILPTPAPVASAFDADPTITPLAFHLERDEKSSLMEVAQKICQSTLGKLFVIGDATGGETLVYEDRYSRSSSVSAALTLTNTMNDLKVSWEYGKRYNKVKASITPYSADSSAVVLGSLENEVPIRSGTTETIELRLRDPAGNERISGFDFITLEEGTDYNASFSSGTPSGDANSAITVTATFGSNTVSVSIENTSGITVYLNMLQVRGLGIYPYDVIDFNYGGGNNVLTYSMPYINDINLGRAIGQVVYTRATLDVPEIADLEFNADANSTLMTGFLTTDISSRVAVVESVTGINIDGYINAWEFEIKDGSLLAVKWLLAHADLQESFFTLDDATRGALDNTTYTLGI